VDGVESTCKARGVTVCYGRTKPVSTTQVCGMMAVIWIHVEIGMKFGAVYKTGAQLVHKFICFHPELNCIFTTSKSFSKRNIPNPPEHGFSYYS
jgi:hypothetical protein